MRAISADDILITKVDRTGRREVKIVTGSQECDSDSKPRSRRLWKSPRKAKSITSIATQLTSVLPLDLNVIILGDGNDFVLRVTLYDIDSISYR